MKKRSVDRRAQKLSDIGALLFLTIMFLVPLMQENVGEKNTLCIATFAINGVFFMFGIRTAIRKYSVSIEMICWIFMFFFLYFAPVLQYKNGQFPWKGRLSDGEILQANLIVFLFSSFFVFGKKMAKHVRVNQLSKKERPAFFCDTFAYSKRARRVVTVLMCLLALYSLSRTGLSGIVTSRNNAIQAFYSGNNLTIELIMESVIPAFMAYTVAEAAQSMVQKKENGIRFCIVSLCLLVCFFPTTLPRYKMAVIYGTIFLVLCPWIKKNNRFFWLFTLGMFIVFPLLGGARRVLGWDSFKGVFEEGLLGVYLKGDYDTYRMLVSALRYVEEEGITWGYQLLGVLFFFVPRSIWPSKPVGSGAMSIQSELGSNVFSNVASPFVGEGFINFGLIGVVLFGVFLGFFAHKTDKAYWDNSDDSKGFSFSPYLFVTFMMFFMLRGDLLSSYAYVCGFVATGYLLRSVSKYL